MSIELDRLVQGTELVEDAHSQPKLRPIGFDDYIGQAKAREQLSVFIQAAKSRQESLDHTLLYGPPGLGKTTLAAIIAHELQANLRQTSGPVLEKAGDLAAVLTRLEPYDVLFVDEIHRLSPAIEEILYPAMEDFQLDIMIGEGPAAQSVKIDLPPFTLVGATTRAGLLTAPLRDRFGIVNRLEFYTADELCQIVTRSSQILGKPILAQAAYEVASRSRGTPRIANRLLKRVRDYAQVAGEAEISLETTRHALQALEVDGLGLDKMDIRLLSIMIDHYDGGPVGLDNLGASLGEEKGTIEEVIEPYLVLQGFIQRTPRGRVATPKAVDYIQQRQ